MSNFSRRDFLKTSLVLTGGSLLSLSPASRKLNFQAEKPNVIVLVLDAMSARNLSLYGYPRATTPGLERIAKSATVYHSHYSAGNFTTSGTASMLTGLYPWTHRGINLGGMVHKDFIKNNLFSLMGEEYFCLAFTQNYLADILLDQFHAGMHQHIPAISFSEERVRPSLSQYFPGDPVPAYFALDDYLFSSGIKDVGSFPPVPIFGFINDLARNGQNFNQPLPDYPNGIPNTSTFSYKNEVVYSKIFNEILNLNNQQSPFLAYFHLFSPHEPYRPRKEFIGIFPDLQFQYKEPTKFSSLDISNDSILERRKEYDEYIANVDHEILSLFLSLLNSGILNNTYLILTADHGELFERGEYGHVTRFLYDSVIHIPLLVIAPKQETRRDIYSPTSNIDLLPTLLKIAGKTPPSGLEGKILPGFGTVGEPRSIFSVEAKGCSSFGRLDKGATVSMINGDYKLIYYSGYRKRPELFELYNLTEDPDEMSDLNLLETTIGSKLKEELLETFEINRKVD